MNCAHYNKQFLITGTNVGRALGMCVVCIMEFCYQHVPIPFLFTRNVLQHILSISKYMHMYKVGALIRSCSFTLYYSCLLYLQ